MVPHLTLCRVDHERADPRVSSVAAPKPEDGWQAPPGVKGGITLSMIGYYDSDLCKIDGVWKLTQLDVKHSLPVFMG